MDVSYEVLLKGLSTSLQNVQVINSSSALPKPCTKPTVISHGHENRNWYWMWIVVVWVFSSPSIMRFLHMLYTFILRAECTSLAHADTFEREKKRVC